MHKGSPVSRSRGFWILSFLLLGFLASGHAAGFSVSVTAVKGKVTKTPNQGSYAAGTALTLTANPSPGYRFIQWTGDATGTQNPLTISVDAAKRITANFEQIPKFTVDVTATRGRVTRAPDRLSYEEGTVVTLRAFPGPNDSFTGWSGDAAGADNPLVITVDANKSIVANTALLTTRMATVEPLATIPGVPAVMSGRAISADGSVVLGDGGYRSGNVGIPRALRWVRGSAAESLGDQTRSIALSGDGSAALLQMVPQARPALWKAATGTVLLSSPNVGGPYGSFSAKALTHDGGVIIGSSFYHLNNSTPARDYAVIWPDGPQGTTFRMSETGLRFGQTKTSAISGSGNLILGTAATRTSDANGDYPKRAISWTGVLNAPEALPFRSDSVVNVSHDGKTIVGWFHPSEAAVSNDGFIWTAESGLKLLPKLPITCLLADATLAGGYDDTPDATYTGYGLPTVTPAGIPTLASAMLINRTGARRALVELVNDGGGDYSQLFTSHPLGVARQGDQIVVLFLGNLVTVPNPLPPAALPLANPGSLFTSSPGFKPVTTFSETYTEATVPRAQGLKGKVGKGVWAINLSGSAAGLDLSTITGQTELSFLVGEHEFTGKLQDDPAWKPGRKTAKWVLQEERAGKVRMIRTVILSWSATSVRVSARCTDAEAYPLLNPPHRGWIGPVSQTTNVELSFANLTGGIHAVNATGTGTRKVATYELTPDGPRGVILSGVKISGSLAK